MLSSTGVTKSRNPPNPDFVRVRGPLKVVQHNPVLILIGVDRPRQGELLHIVHALYPARLCLGFAQRRQEQTRQDGDDGDDDEEFDEGESTRSA